MVGLDAYRRSQVTVRVLQPEAVQLEAGGSSRTISVGVSWPEDGYCIGQFQVEARETSAQVRVIDVVSRESHYGSCPGVGTAHHLAWGRFGLKTPLGARVVVRDRDGSALPVLPT